MSAATIAENGYACKPQMVCNVKYAFAMVERRKAVNLPRDIRGTLARNLEVLMGVKEAWSSQPKIAHLSGMAQSSVGRILRAEVYATLENLEGLARAFRCQPWQLLLPTIRVDSKGVIEDHRDPIAAQTLERFDAALQHLASLQHEMLGMNLPSGHPERSAINMPTTERESKQEGQHEKEDRPAKNARKRSGA